MTTNTLFRATAYRLERYDTPADQQQPEVTVYLEAEHATAASVKLLRALALLWGCETPDIEFYNLMSEADLFGAGGAGTPEMGDAALLCNGWYHGPLFVRPDRTLMLVRPRTLARLHQAQRPAATWARRQREAVLLANGIDRAEASRRSQLVAEAQATPPLPAEPMPWVTVQMPRRAASAPGA